MTIREIVIISRGCKLRDIFVRLGFSFPSEKCQISSTPDLPSD